MKALASLFACLLAAGTALAQSTTVDAEVVLTTPGATCTFTVANDLDFGSVEKPSTGSGSVTISATSGARSSSGAVVSGSSTVGQVRLLGQHVSSYTVSRTYPSALTNSTEPLTFAGTWAESTTSNSGYTSISTSTYTGTAGGAGTTFLHYFRFGGTVSGITWSDGNGTYTGSISTSATCS